MVSPFVRALAPGTMGGNIPDFYPYKIDYSCLFDSAYLYRSQIADNRKIFTVSFWVKRVDLGTKQFIFLAQNDSRLYFDTDNKLHLYEKSGLGAAHYLYTDTVFSDTTNWYHVVVAYDSTQAVQADRCTIWVDGSEVNYTASNAIEQDREMDFGDSNVDSYIGVYAQATPNSYFDGYLAEMHFTHEALTASDFGQFKSSIWIPKEYTGSYSVNGFYLDFSNASHFGEDQSGKDNDFTDYNLSTDDQSEDTPTSDR